jgi:uncharacterized protein
MSMPRLLCLAIVTGACGSCASAPIHYYSLTSAPNAMSPGTRPACCNLEVASVQIPAEVDRAELVARQSDSELVVLDNEAWISPLRDEIKSALLNEIGLRMSGRKAEATAPQKITVRVHVQHFESVPASYALVQVAWRLTLSLPSNEVTCDCQTTAKMEVAPGVPALIRGHQQALAKVGDQIAASILELQQGGDPPCPAE